MTGENVYGCLMKFKINKDLELELHELLAYGDDMFNKKIYNNNNTNNHPKNNNNVSSFHKILSTCFHY